MGIAAIDAQLIIVEKAIAGINGAATRPKLATEFPDLPFLLNDYDSNDFLRLYDVAFGQIGYEWKYKIKCLISVPGLATIPEWSTSIQPFFQAFVEAMFSHLTLNNTCDNNDWGGNFKAGLGIEYLSETYFGFEVNWLFRERVTPTIPIAP